MNRIATVLVSLCMVCSYSVSGQQPKGLIVPSNITFSPDTTVNGKLILRDSKSAGSLIGGVSQPKMHDSRQRLCPFSYFLNDKGSQYLLAYLYEGDCQGEYSGFEIGYVEDMTWLDEVESDKTSEVQFATESGIRLGMSVQELVRIKGKPSHKSEDEDGDRFSYRIDEQSDFCRRYQMPEYTMRVLVTEGTVHRISFGFEYP